MRVITARSGAACKTSRIYTQKVSGVLRVSSYCPLSRWGKMTRKVLPIPNLLSTAIVPPC